MANIINHEENSHLERFLAPPRIAVIATLGRTGIPQLTPNWYRFAAGKLTVSTTKDRIKCQNISRDPRIAVCIYVDEPDEKGYVTLRGVAEIIDDESILPETRAIIERYTKKHLPWATSMSTLRAEGRVIVSMTVEKIHSMNLQQSVVS